MKYITDIYTYFLYNNHICIVLDKCGNSMLSEIEIGEYEGLPLSRIQSIIRDTLTGLNALHNLSVIHCDVKPENIVNVINGDGHVKLIDLGSCTIVNNVQASYAQSRYYRAPEVAFRLDYGTKADIWSTGCVAAELMLGLPLFPAETESHLICLIEQMLGPYPPSIRVATERHDEFFLPDETLKSPELICSENGENFTEFRPYFVQQHLDDIIMNFSFAENLTEEQIDQEEHVRRIFIDFLQKMLKLDPNERMSAEEALHHEFMLLDLQ